MDHLSIDMPSVEEPTGRSAAALDDVDRALLRQLAADGRLSMRTLAERLRISRSSVYARMERLTAEHVITGYAARIDPIRAGLGTTAYVLVNIDQTGWRSISERLREIPYVQHIALVGGDVDMMMLVRTPDNATLRDVVLARVHAVAGVRSTRTWLVFDEVAGRQQLQ